jgi:hypothetical protein
LRHLGEEVVFLGEEEEAGEEVVEDKLPQGVVGDK